MNYDYDEEVYEKFMHNFELLKTIIRQNGSEDQLKVDLSKIDNLINKKMSGIWTGKDNIYENEKATIFRPEADEDVTSERLQYMQNAKTPYIKIVGATIDLKNETMCFKGREKVIFEKCIFIGANAEGVYETSSVQDQRIPISIFECCEVWIINCQFKEFGSRTIWLEKIENVYIGRSEFNNCRCQIIYDNLENKGKYLGGVIYSQNSFENIKIYINNTRFEMCGGRSRDYHDRSACISNCKVEALECIFKDCYYKRNTYGDFSNGNNVSEAKFDTMFSSDSKAIRCKFENSARFN